MTIPNKELVRKRFNKNLKTYKCEATVQKNISKILANKLSELSNNNFERILEIGCGTGFLTKEIWTQFHPESFYLNDLVADAYFETLDYTNGENLRVSEFIEGDAEILDFPTNLDGIFSSSCFQWFNNLDVFLKKAGKLLNECGILAFSTFGEYHFNEIRQITGQGLDYKTLAELLDLLAGEYEVLYTHEWQYEEEFNNPYEVLRHMKNTGVNGLNQVFFGRNKMDLFIQKYWQNFSKELNTVFLTYHPILIIARKTSFSKVQNIPQVKPVIINSVD